MKALFDALRAPSVEGVDVDTDDRFRAHSTMLARKKMLQGVFVDFHQLFDRLDRRFLKGSGARVEIGAGVSPIRSSFKDVLASDVVPHPSLDLTLDAEDMELDASSIRVLFAQNCFHHLPHPDRFFRELERVLEVGGGAILIEPYYGPVASFVFRRLFRTEGFDKRYGSWETPVSGPMNGANQALSYIVFVRDRAVFERLYPSLRIVHQEPCVNYLRYIASGGLNFRQLLPDFMIPILSGLEWLLTPLRSWFALHHVIVIRKDAG